MIRTGLAVAAAALLAASAWAQQPQPSPTPAAPPPPDFSKVEIKTTDLGDGVYMLEGQGGNITVAIAKDGIIMVDGEFAPLHDKIKAAIATISSRRSNSSSTRISMAITPAATRPLPRTARSIVAHVNVKNPARCRHHQRADRRQDAAGGARALPAKTYTDSFKIMMTGRVADLKHIANAHTDGDTYVWFKTANVLATGDTFTNGRYPNIDFANGGNIKGMIAAADAYLKLANDKTPDRAGPRPDRRQGGADGLPHHAGHRARPHGDSWSRRARARTTWSRQSPSPISTPNGRRPSSPARTSFAWSITRSPTSRKQEAAAQADPAPELDVMKELIGIAEQIAAKLIARKQTIAVAESSTGGLISASLLAVPGASAYFLGGAVVYTRDARRRADGHPDEAMEGMRSASEPYAKLLAEQIAPALRHRLGPVRDRRHRPDRQPLRRRRRP